MAALTPAQIELSKYVILNAEFVELVVFIAVPAFAVFVALAAFAVIAMLSMLIILAVFVLLTYLVPSLRPNCLPSYDVQSVASWQSTPLDYPAAKPQYARSVRSFSAASPCCF